MAIPFGPSRRAHREDPADPPKTAGAGSLTACPLCGEGSLRPSWLGALRYGAKEFSYVECSGCRSLHCRPMPDAGDLEAMYGASYGANTAPESIEDPKEPEWVLGWLERRTPGTFLDYGCGGGDLLVAAKERGWNVLGVELVREVVEKASRRTGLPIAVADEALDGGPLADILHVGDVLEHLTDLDREMPRILSLLKPGGLLLAQGPLEANDNLFTWAVRLGRSLSGWRPIEMPPYHVILATAEGQWALFHRFGLTVLERRVSEVFWPAPARIAWKDWRSPRALALHSLRLISRAVSRLRPDRWGNRYRFAGRLEEKGSLRP